VVQAASHYLENKDLQAEVRNEWYREYPEHTQTLLTHGCTVVSQEVKAAEDIKLGEGAVIREGLKKIAVYKDEQGKTHSCSAVCAHRGCIVSWNGFEKTWDCPCHGSRYNAMGKVLNGPSMKDLAQL
jgi:Rieske Fe-S protein